jgi:periplasmic divalent cation tolerance protein
MGRLEHLLQLIVERNTRMAKSVSKHIVVFITASSYEEAHKISEALVSQKKAACVNIVPRVNSIFTWKDKLEKSEESLLIVKTRTKLLPDVVTLVKWLHSYEVPEIIALPIIEGNEDYLEWIDKETGKHEKRDKGRRRANRD